MIVQEDKASAHNSKYQQEIFSLHKILRLIWLGNSPDINIIEPYWPQMKCKTTKKGASKTQKEMEECQYKYWHKLSQKQIQNWITRIPRHLDKICHLKSDNYYKKGWIDG